MAKDIWVDRDGSYGVIQRVDIDTSNWTSSDWDEFRYSPDEDRYSPDEDRYSPDEDRLVLAQALELKNRKRTN